MLDICHEGDFMALWSVHSSSRARDRVIQRRGWVDTPALAFSQLGERVDVPRAPMTQYSYWRSSLSDRWPGNWDVLSKDEVRVWRYVRPIGWPLVFREAYCSRPLPPPFLLYHNRTTIDILLTFLRAMLYTCGVCNNCSIVIQVGGNAQVYRKYFLNTWAVKFFL